MAGTQRENWEVQKKSSSSTEVILPFFGAIVLGGGLLPKSAGCEQLLVASSFAPVTEPTQK